MKVEDPRTPAQNLAANSFTLIQSLASLEEQIQPFRVGTLHYLTIRTLEPSQALSIQGPYLFK